MCFLLENTEKCLCQKEWEEKLLLVRVSALPEATGSWEGDLEAAPCPLQPAQAACTAQQQPEPSCGGAGGCLPSLTRTAVVGLSPAVGSCPFSSRDAG